MPDDVLTKAELTVVLVFFFLLTAAGASLGAYAVQDFADARASVSWPRTEGVVLSARGGAFRYAYVADGKSRESRRARFATANRFAGAFERPAPGQSVTVRYNPARPDDAVLQPGGSGGVFALMVGLSGVLLFIGLGGLIRTLVISHEIGRSAEFGAATANGAR